MTSAELSVLKNALLIVGLEEVNAYKNLPDEVFEFSNEFEQKIKEINKKRKSLLYRTTKTVPRRVALVSAAVIMTFCLMMTISAIRIPVINFFVNLYEDFIGISFDEEEEDFNIPTTIEQVHLPTYMVDGYKQTDSQKFRDVVETYWENDSYLIILYQEIMEEEFKMNFDNNHEGYEKISVNNKIVYYILNKGEYMLLWNDGSYVYTLILPESIPLVEIEKIIGSMQ